VHNSKNNTDKDFRPIKQSLATIMLHEEHPSLQPRNGQKRMLRCLKAVKMFVQSPIIFFNPFLLVLAKVAGYAHRIL